MIFSAFIDGSCEGNPGDSGCGMVLQDGRNNVLVKSGWYLGQGTNNTAEYHGLIRCLELVQKYEIRNLVVYSDSQLLVNQVRGSYRVKKPHLADLHDQVTSLLKEKRFSFDIVYVPRERNREADGLARKAIRLKKDIQEISVHLPEHGG